MRRGITTQQAVNGANGVNSTKNINATHHPLTCNFGSDNWAGCHPSISASLSQHAAGFATPYGDSAFDHSIARKFSEVFEKECAVFFVGTGTAGNALALASVAKPGGMVFAHREAHTIVDECGAPEFLSGGLRISPVGGEEGKLGVEGLRKEVERPTESGTVYSLEELEGLTAAAREKDLPVLMDGARFANALVSLGCSPAEMTWKRGVDILSFGGTKNGCWCAEAVVFFKPEMARDFVWLRKRAGHLLSKSRFVSAQLEAYLQDGLWLEIARHSNRMAGALREIFEGNAEGRLLRTPQANEVFVILGKAKAAELEKEGVVFLEWPAPAGAHVGEDEQVCRFVTSFATTEGDIERMMVLMK
ncbi:Threonine aldolase [Saxophila tyrrhenica]|uniref:Threonine aldolase n=1 Tax=Saxophila tyrrhenica TaxID=1690608 RepID=A0AAV9PBI9_9PEZI|nr:Threonine aldolase [Saxophila tyrrhenica]